MPPVAEITPDQINKNANELTRSINGHIISHIRDLNFKVTNAVSMIAAAPNARDNVPDIVAAQLLDGAKAQCAEIVAELDKAMAALKNLRVPPPAKQE